MTKQATAATTMKVTLKATETLKPYENNPRVNDEAVDAVAASIKEFGFRQPIVVDADGVIICGHTRWKAARKLGLARVPVHVATDLSPEQVQAYRLADNATGELATWDISALAGELETLTMRGISPETLGFRPEEIEALLSSERAIERQGDEHAGSSPWDRVGEATDGVIFAFGDVHCRIATEVYARWRSKVPDHKIPSYVEEQIHALCGD